MKGTKTMLKNVLGAFNHFVNITNPITMYNLQERNAQSNRQLAIALTIGLHLAVGAALFLQSTGKTTATTPATAAKTVVKTPQPKAVNMP
jgi:hypothetical protein